MSKIGKALTKAKQESEQQNRNLEAKVQEFSRPTKPIPGPALTDVQYPNWNLQEKNRIFSTFREQSKQDVYNLLRTQILQQTVGLGLNTIMITSPGPGEGKTTTAINLGLSMARNDQYTALVVDTHLRAPKVHEYLGLNCEHGLSDYLLNGKPISELMVTPNEETFVIMPAGRCEGLECSTDILSSLSMMILAKELKKRYSDRYVFFDCPHLLGMPDTLVFSSYVDTVLLVIEANKTRQDEVQNALDVLKDQNVLGVVLNKAR